MDTTPTANESVRLLVENLRRNGKQVPSRLSEIPGFPYSRFDQLQAAILSRAVLIQRFSFHYDTRLFNLLASPFQRFLSAFYITVAYVVPVISIVMAFVHSWWWLLGIPAIAVGLSRTKRLYSQVMFSSAFQSEAVFSFLYFARQVCITSADYRTCHYWGREQSDQRGDA